MRYTIAIKKDDHDKRDDILYLLKRFFSLLVIVIFVFLIAWGMAKFFYKPENGVEKNILPYVLEFSASITSLLSIIWAVQSYWRLRYIDKQVEKWQPHKNIDEWSDPFTFHVLAESHKEWAQLWFCWCIAIFMSGLTYAIFNIYHPQSTNITQMNWSSTIYTIIREQAPSSFIYLLFGVSWYWASKHYRSHWHNFVINAYRHRALYRFEQLRDDIQKKMDEKKYTSKAEETILELFRLSGILLLIPGDSSYLDKVGSEEISKAILQMEEVAKAFTRSN